jgi:hypothetical protein
VLENPRVRMALFALMVLVLGAGAWIGLRPPPTPVEDVSATAPSQAPVATPSGQISGSPSGQPPSPQPTQSATMSPSATPSGEPSVIGAPDAENPDAAEGPLAKVTTGEIAAFLKVFNTFNWQETPTAFVDRVVAAGAVPGSGAALPPYSGASLDYCMESYCATEFIEASNIKISKGALITAEATVRLSQFGKATTQVLSCELVRAPANKDMDGLFVDAFCLGPNG